MLNLPELANVSCPKCKQVGVLALEEFFKACPLTYSLSGTQIKFNATREYRLVCPCGFSEEGKKG